MSNKGAFELDASQVLKGFNLAESVVKEAAKRGVHDSMDDLKRISVNIAPIDESTLRKSAKYRVTPRKDSIIGELTFSASNNTDGYGQFNYAYWTHEMEYNLGEQSKAAPGTDGYEVGNKYLERPLKGESAKYLKWIAEEIKGALGK